MKTKIETKKTIPKLKKPKKEFYIGGVSMKDILFFTKNLGIMLKSGSTLAEALNVLQQQAKGKMKQTLVEMSAKIQAGVSFCDTLSDHPKVFSEIYINIVKIGEESGTLDKNILYLGDQIANSYKLRKKNCRSHDLSCNYFKWSSFFKYWRFNFCFTKN